jgi:hypothetical protein
VARGNARRVLFAYLAIVHYPNSFCGIVRFCFLQRGKSGSVDIAASYTYIGLPALILFLALITRRERTQVLTIVTGAWTNMSIEHTARTAPTRAT